MTSDARRGRRTWMELPLLTARQVEILVAAGRGLTVDETARLLFISAETVKRHRADARRALGTGTTARAVHLARERGLLPEAS